MYCGKCGAQISDESKFCPKCGNAICMEKKRNIPVKITKTKKKIKIGIMLVSVLILALFIIGGGKSAKDIGLKACKTTEEGDIETYYKLLSQPYIDYMVGSQGWYSNAEEFKEELRSWSEDRKRLVASDCGENARKEYQVRRIKKYEGEELQTLREILQREYGYEAGKIKGAVLVEVSIKASGENGNSTYINPVACVKIGRSWYVHRPGFDFME